MDWQAWHREYEDPASWQARRLRVVQERIRVALDSLPLGPLRLVSLCAGQGRDLLAVLASHPRGADVRARLVELDGRNSAVAAETARAVGLDQVEVVTGDAARTDQYSGMAPADMVLACGLFGNISDYDIERTIAFCPELCAGGGIVIWTRHRLAPDRVPLICDLFRQHGFDLKWLSGPDAVYGVGVHRFSGAPRPLTLGARMFSFVGYDVLSRG
jgi:hypothetical protein